MGAVPAVDVERELDQRAFDGDQVDAGRWNGHGRTSVARTGRPNCNRCMLVVKRGESHDPWKGKRNAGARCADLPLFAGDQPSPAERRTVCFRAAPPRLSENRHRSG